MYVSQPTFTPAQGYKPTAAVVPPPTSMDLQMQLAQHKRRLTNELKAAGMKRWGFWFSEQKLLPVTIHPNEHIEGIVYGKYLGGLAYLVATDRRVIFLDKKPIFTKSDELAYHVVSGVNFAKNAAVATVTLHTRIGDYTLKTFNVPAAERFRDYIEQRCLERQNWEMPDYEAYDPVRT